MFEKILIANRGEIACRVIKTARRMGIATVAVCSEADSNALHARMADEAVVIGPPPSAESYLKADKIIEVCKQTGAEAVHPGYGFLSENKSFALALADAGIAFIGPPAGAIEAMGDKITSKRLADAAGVNTIPGHPDAVADADEAVAIADRIGYPVMLKASAGGGGKGMRVAYGPEEARDGFERATNEATSSFGDGRVFVEKFIENPRHIEIQVLADGHGNTVHLFERECSIQRRHQKVIEEAPSPFLDAETRRAMGAQAVALAKAVDYRSAGTVEFVVDPDRNFFFLEMNTRLQVEHPVTEMITGLDLVELMIRVANGEKLPFTQKDLEIRGWAVEARIYAEDPFRNFLPSIGRLTRYIPPTDAEGAVRVDTGVFEGGEISMFYDPMIAKLVTHGDDRAEAIARMRQSLDAFLIRGVNHNIAFLAALMAHPRFQAGDISTAFIAEEYPDGFDPSDLPPEDSKYLVATAACVHYALQHRAAQISGQVPGHERKVAGTWVVLMRDARHEVDVQPAAAGYALTIDGEAVQVVTAWTLGAPLFRAEIAGREVCVQVERAEAAYRLTHGGAQVDALVMTAQGAALQALMPEKQAADTSKMLLSPMPGLLVSLKVETGTEVKAGEELCVVEAMKMENVLRAERDGVVAEIKAAPGDSLMVDQVIIEFE